MSERTEPRLLRQEVWLYLRAHPESRPADIAKGVNAGPTCVRHTLQRLERQEFVKGKGRVHTRRYIALGEQPPFGRRESATRVNHQRQEPPPQPCWLAVFWA